MTFHLIIAELKIWKLSPKFDDSHKPSKQKIAHENQTVSLVISPLYWDMSRVQNYVILERGATVFPSSLAQQYTSSVLNRDQL